MRLLLLFSPASLESGHLRMLPEILRKEIEGVVLKVPLFNFESANEVATAFHAVDVEEIHIIEKEPRQLGGRALDSFIQYFEAAPSLSHYLTALQLLNRLDLSGTFRFLDREALARLSIYRIINYLRLNEFDLAVFPTTPHTFFDFLTFSLCKFLGVPTLFFQPVPFVPLMVPHVGFETRKAISDENSGNSEESFPFRKEFEESLQVLTKGGSPRYMESQDSMMARANSIVGRWAGVLQSLRWLRSRRFPESLDFVGSRLFSSVLKPLLVLVLSRGLEKSLRSRIKELTFQKDVTRNFAMFALHYEPERTSIPEGFPIASQIDAVAIARKILPEDITLLVKEHKSQGSPALRGFAGRSQFLYDFASSLPNTLVLGPSLDTRRIIEKATCVFTLTGTIGVEAASRGIPVAYFGSPWWSGLPGTTRINSATTYDEILVRVEPSPDSATKALVKLLESRAIPGICSEDPVDYQRRNGQLGAEFWDSSSQAIALEILDLIREIPDLNK